MEDLSTGTTATQSEGESITSSTNILSSSENTNNENREKELLTQSESVQTVSTKSDEGEEKVEDRQVEGVPETGQEIPKAENPSGDDYAKNVSYNEEGVAIYTDPNTKYQYKWSNEKNSWEPIETSAGTGANPFENEHYRWCSETNQWIPKSETSAPPADSDKLENEYYKWDKDSNQWVPKTQSSDVTCGYEDGVHTYTDKDGTVFFWDVEKNAWFPKIDDDFMARYQLNYGFIDNTSIETQKQGDNSSKDPAVESDNSKPSVQTSETGSGAPKRKAPEPPKWFDIPPEQNTKVYVSNLPLDITEEEFVEVMSKCGLIMRDPQSHKFKIKLYTESDGQLKGDGLCDYIKVESVDLALNLLDGYDVRGNTIKVQPAKFQMRGEYNPKLKPKKKKKDKEKLQKMKEKLFDWRPEKMRGERSKHERVVIIKNLFSPEIFDKEVHLIIDYQNDLREECVKCGTVRKVVLYDRHPEGVAQIIMADPEEADIVVQMMNGRFFGKRKLTAEIWDGKTKYQIAETEAEVKERLSKWDKFLETGEKERLEKEAAESIERGKAAEEEKTSKTPTEPQEKEAVDRIESGKTEEMDKSSKALQEPHEKEATESMQSDEVKDTDEIKAAEVLPED